ncbi:MAG: serine/threonine-protein kinase, partial [Pirellulaceae bacterium]
MSNDNTYQTIDENIRQQFESAWAAGNPQPIEALVGEPASANYLATLEELVHIELEFRWQERDPLIRPQLEEYLDRFESLGDPAILSRLLAQEVKLRMALGETPSSSEYQQRFPGVEIEFPATDQASQDTGIRSEDDVDTQREMPTMAPESTAEPADLDSATMADVQQPVKRKIMLEGDFVPGYDLLGELGRGGMGVVYQARDQKLKRIVAIKMILSGVHASEEDMQRFQVEAEAVAKLQHPNIVQIFEVGEHKGNPYISLEYQEGGGLDKKIEGTPQNVEESAQLIETLARAMQVAHSQDIIHRDLKPANILLSADGEPKITDFGLAKRMDEDSNQTKSGAVMGTPSYMAPEQASSSNQTLSPAADTYALGAILYHLVTGRPPFRAETQLDTLMQVISDEPLPPRRLNNKIAADLETICLKCLQKDISRRYLSAEELAEDLRRFLAGEPIAARPVTGLERTWKWARRRPAVAGLIGVTVVAAVALAIYGVSYNRLLKGSLQVAENLRYEEQEQRKLAEEGHKRAEGNLNMAAQLVEKYLTELSENELMNVPKMEGLRRELLEEALLYYEKFVEQDADDVLLTKKLASAHNRLGSVLRDLGENSRSIDHFQKALEISEKLRKDYPYDAGVNNRVAANEAALGIAYRRTGDLEKAEVLLKKAMDHSTTRLNLGMIYNNLGSLCNEKGEYGNGSKWLGQAIRIYSEELASPQSYPNTNEQEIIRGLARSNNDYGRSLAQQAKHAEKNEDRQAKQNEALDAYEKGIAGYRRLLERSP